MFIRKHKNESGTTSIGDKKRLTLTVKLRDDVQVF